MDRVSVGEASKYKYYFSRPEPVFATQPLLQHNRVKYLNNIVEQDHRAIKRLVNPGMGFGSFNTARRTLRGYEAINMIRKGQIQGVAKGNIRAQVEFASQIFGVAA